MKNKRIIKNINLDWKFLRGEQEQPGYKGVDDSSWRTITLPHDWSVEEPFSKEHSSGTGYLSGGVGWYRKRFSLPEELQGKKVYVTFEGIYNNSQVWCNSYYIGKRPYGYSTIVYDLTPFIEFGKVDNVLSVKVDRKDIADSRWFTGSGIYRDVYLTITDEIHIDNYGVFVTTPEVSNAKATVLVDFKVCNETQEDVKVTIKNTLYDNKNEIVSSTSDEYKIKKENKLNNKQNLNVIVPKLWSTTDPNLYRLVTEVIKNGEVIDDFETPVGIRWFSFDSEKGFFLNDKNMKIKGVCVHHDAGCLGAAVPQKVWEGRLKDLQEMGCNAIRTSHNPPAPGLLDLCDRMGFLVMDEAFDEWEGVKNKWWQGHNVYPPKHFGYYEDFPQWHEKDLKDMIIRDRNHPSIILWSIGNEVDYPNDPYCHPSFEVMTGNNDTNKPKREREYDPNKPNAKRLAEIAKVLVKLVKECDTTRPVTSALAFPELSNLTGYSDALDIVGYNYKEHLYAENHEKRPDRVIYGSENSNSAEAWAAVLNNQYICGQFIWTGVDYLGEAKGWPIRIAQSGFLDVGGFKKPVYYHRKSLWKEDKIVYLTSRCNGNNETHWNWKQGDMVEVICYTNCEEVELFLNDKSLGTKKLADLKDYSINWEVPFEQGCLRAIAKSENGENVTCKLTTASEPKRLLAVAEDSKLKADGQDITHVVVQVADEENRLVYLSDARIDISIDGPGEILGIENGDPQDLESYSSKFRKAFKGRLIVYIRAKTQPGTIRLTATAPGLVSTRIALEVN